MGFCRIIAAQQAAAMLPSPYPAGTTFSHQAIAPPLGLGLGLGFRSQQAEPPSATWRCSPTSTSCLLQGSLHTMQTCCAPAIHSYPPLPCTRPRLMTRSLWGRNRPSEERAPPSMRRNEPSSFPPSPSPSSLPNPSQNPTPGSGSASLSHKPSPSLSASPAAESSHKKDGDSGSSSSTSLLPARQRRRRMRLGLWAWLRARRVLLRLATGFQEVAQRAKFVLLAALLLAAASLAVRQHPAPQPSVSVGYSTFVDKVRKGAIRGVAIEEGSSRVFFDLNAAEEGAMQSAVSALVGEASVGSLLSGSAAAVGGGAVGAYSGGIGGSMAEAAATAAAAGGGSGGLAQLFDSASRQLAEAAGAASSPSIAAATVASSTAVPASAAAAAATAAAGGEQATTSHIAGNFSPLLNRLLSPPPRPPPLWPFVTRRVRGDEAFLLPLLLQSGVEFSSLPARSTSALRSVALTLLTVWLPVAPLVYLMWRQLNGRGKQWRAVKQGRAVSFGDVAGIEEAKKELMEIVLCVKRVPPYDSPSLKVPRGVLLEGPPGSGKTLLARAVASEAGVPIFAASASEFVEMFVGRGAARVRQLFAEARSAAPSVVFIDEIDAVGGRRGLSSNDERDQTLNQLLTELDGFGTDDDGVLFLAATNRPQALDPALCRAGRLSRRVRVGLPDEAGRVAVLRVHLREVQLKERDKGELVLAIVANNTGGFSGADLANVVQEASLLAARRGDNEVCLDDLLKATDRWRYGIGGDLKSNFMMAASEWLRNLQGGDGNGKIIPAGSSK